MRDDDEHAIGTLSLLGSEPRSLSERDVKLLEALANDVMTSLRNARTIWGDVPEADTASRQAPSAIVAQMVPNGA